MAINLSSVVNDQDLGAQNYTIQRSTNGAFQLSGYVDGKTLIFNFGVIQQASSKDLTMVPEGDRIDGMITFWSQFQLFTTNLTGLSDIITWHGDNYRIMGAADRSDFGFWKAVGVRMTGA